MAALTKEQIEDYKRSPEFQEMLAKAVQAQVSPEDQRRACATPLPGGALDACEPVPRKVCGLVMVPATAGHVGVLQRIDSSFYRKIFVDKEAAITPEDFLVALYVFSEPSANSRRLLRECFAKGNGVEEFREHALNVVADRVPLMRIGEAEAELVAHIADAEKTFVGLRPVNGTDGTEATNGNPSMASHT
jgi:hypothetical protein